MNNYQKIYKHLGDELSKEIFGYRVLYSETEDKRWLKKLLLTFPEGKELLKKLGSKDKKKVMFGAGNYGKEIVNLFPVGWECFVDNHKKGECCGIPVLSFRDYLRTYREADIFIGSPIYHKEMREQLLEYEIDEEQIIDIWEHFIPAACRQYFDLSELPHDENEVFVDCGCLDGQTSKNFIKWCNNQYKHIYAFEPDKNSIIQCKATLSHAKADIYQLGVWKKQAELHFHEALAEGASCISGDGEQIVMVNSLDSVLDKKEVSFIKMDIEGAELEALQGAKKLIQRNTPKLAICVYHKLPDIYEIPQLLLEYNPNYIFYLRHYFFMECETVLYAIDARKLKKGN